MKYIQHISTENLKGIGKIKTTVWPQFGVIFLSQFAMVVCLSQQSCQKSLIPKIPIKSGIISNTVWSPNKL